MRMWMLPARALCRQHLLGEHAEIHKAVGNLKHTGKWARSLIRKGYLDPRSFRSRHAELAAEMKRRGYNHRSPLEFPDSLVAEFGPVHIDTDKAREDLAGRCEECRKGLENED